MTSSKKKRLNRKRNRIMKQILTSWDLVTVSEMDNINIITKEKQNPLYLFLSYFLFK